MWNKHYECCVVCNTTDKPHKSRWLCEVCYQTKYQRDRYLLNKQNKKKKNNKTNLEDRLIEKQEQLNVLLNKLLEKVKNWDIKLVRKIWDKTYSYPVKIPLKPRFLWIKWSTCDSIYKQREEQYYKELWVYKYKLLCYDLLTYYYVNWNINWFIKI